MAVVNLDTKGLRCPQPVLKIAAKMPELSDGDVLVVVADCPTIEEDIRKWCDRMKKGILDLHREGPTVTVKIQF
jgi:tRNA 2-thiouridine synthesizing protein A